jgi:flagellar hook protein FlgE
MALTSTLFTGLSGLDANQTWLNVVGNNIANVNTVSFKASSVLFTPQFYVTQQAGSAPTGNFGGTNPAQTGLGTQVAAVEKDLTPGAIDTTGVDTDMAIDGSGYFVLNSGAGQQYTRDGAFTLNSANQLVTSAGAYVQGYGADANGNILLGSLQNVTIPLGQATQAKATENVEMQGNLNASGAVAGGSTILNSGSFTTAAGAPTSSSLLTDLTTTGSSPTALFTSGDVLNLAGTAGSAQLPSASFTITSGSTVGDLENFINGALGINTSVSEAGNPPPGATLQTTGSNAQLTIIGNSGSANVLTLGSEGLTDTTSGTNPLTFSGGTYTDPVSSTVYQNDPVGESTKTAITAYDSLGTPITVNVTAVLESTASTGNTWRFYATSPDNLGGNGLDVGTGTLTFNNDGQLSASTGTTITVDRTGSGAGTPVTMDLNFGNTTSLASSTSNLVMGSQDGSGIGTLTGFSVGADGTITGAFSNGLTKNLGQIAMANFNNPQGLIDEGGNVFEAGANSGSAQITTAETDSTGQIRSGALEESNVDISKEFINLIIASTGFSAASHVISTSNQLLTQLLNSGGGL